MMACTSSGSGMVITGGILEFYGKQGLFVAPAALTAPAARWRFRLRQSYGGQVAPGRDDDTTTTTLRVSSTDCVPWWRRASRGAGVRIGRIASRWSFAERLAIRPILTPANAGQGRRR